MSANRNEQTRSTSPGSPSGAAGFPVQPPAPPPAVGFAANAYGNRKDKDYATIIKSKNLDLHYKSVTFGTFGSFGSGTWSVISVACDPLTHPRASDDYNPWNSPGPKRDFTLSLGFALQRANSRMLRNADKRRRLARSSGKYSSGTRPTSSDEDY